ATLAPYVSIGLPQIGALFPYAERTSAERFKEVLSGGCRVTGIDRLADQVRDGPARSLCYAIKFTALPVVQIDLGSSHHDVCIIHHALALRDQSPPRLSRD